MSFTSSSDFSSVFISALNVGERKRGKMNERVSEKERERGREKERGRERAREGG